MATWKKDYCGVKEKKKRKNIVAKKKKLEKENCNVK